MQIPIPTDQLLLALIKNDLINTRLVHGLNQLGLAADNYFLNLGQTVLDIMGFPHTFATDAVFERYFALTRRALHLDISESHAVLDALAQEIYRELNALRLPD